MRAPLKKVFMARYVVLAEIFGYLLAATLLTAWIIFFFIHIDEHCFGSGPISPALLVLQSPERAVLDEIFPKNGAWVRQDEVIVALNLDEKAIAARQAHFDLKSLGKQIVTLADEPDKRSALETHLTEVLKEMESLKTGTIRKEITAPAPGLLHITLETTTTGQVVQGKLGDILSDQIVQIEVELGTMNRARVMVDQDVKVRIVFSKDEKYKLMGKVLKKIAANKIIVEAPVPETQIAVIESLTELILHPVDEEDAVKAEVKVVVGNVRLVKFLFTKKATLQKPKKDDEKDKGFFAGMWAKFRGLFTRDEKLPAPGDEASGADFQDLVGPEEEDESVPALREGEEHSDRSYEAPPPTPPESLPIK